MQISTRLTVELGNSMFILQVPAAVAVDLVHLHSPSGTTLEGVMALVMKEPGM